MVVKLEDTGVQGHFAFVVNNIDKHVFKNENRK